VGVGESPETKSTMKPWIIAGVIFGTLLFGAALVFAAVLGTYNSAKALRVSYDMKLKANEGAFDNMWKKIKGAADVTEAQRDALKSILVGYADARSKGQGDGGTLAKWVQESVPNVDTSTFNNLQNIIAGSRDSWTFNQIELVGIAEEYNKLLARQPSGFILGLFGMTEAINPKVITSTRTEQTFTAGKDDDVSVFAKKP